MTKILFYLFALALWLSPALAPEAYALPVSAPVFSKDKLDIKTAKGVRHFIIEVAKTPDEQEYGFMHRTNIPANHGMIFIMPQDRDIQMWMKNTPLPLDMLFIDSHGRIAYIAENAPPNSTKIISSGQQVRAVIELHGGTAAMDGIKAGDRVIYSAFAP